MNKVMKRIFNRKVPPPSNLNPEENRIWLGWNEFGDKEVAREASAKGFYVNLAVKFIATRKGVEIRDAEKWFIDEVLKWFEELLMRKQIFRATHILNNIGLDPFIELTKVFCKTEERGLREYIGQHLLKHEKLESSLKDCWILLNNLESNEILLTSFRNDNHSINIKTILTLDSHLRSKIAATLFFINYDIQLEHFLNAQCLWTFLLLNNKIDVIKLWINVQYSERQLEWGITNLRADILEILIQLFKAHSITDSLVNVISEKYFSVPLEVQNAILDELARYGVFNIVDSSSLLNLLRRLKNTGNVIKYKQILSSEKSSLNVETFHDLLLDHCINCDLSGVINLCFLENGCHNILFVNRSNAVINLIKSIQATVLDINNCSVLRMNFLRVAQFLNCDVVAYLNTNPTVLLALIILDHNVNMAYLTKSSGHLFLIDNVEVNFDNLFLTIPIFNLVMHERLPFESTTTWELLEKHSSLLVNKDFQQILESGPHFGSSSLAEKSGYKKTVDATFFLPHCQPSKACRVAMFDSIKSIEIQPVHYTKIHKLSLKRFADITTSASAVAFLEMIGESSEKLRIHLEAIRIISDTLLNDFSNIDEIVDLFIHVERKPDKIVCYLERAVINTIQYLDLENNFLEALKSYTIVIKFCIVHCLKLPEGLLNLFAYNNLWLPFLICAQIHNYPTYQIRVLVQNFKNPNLLEHINHSVLHTFDVDTLMEKRNARSSLYLKIGVRHAPRRPGEDSMHSSVSNMSLESVGSSVSSSDTSEFSESDVLDMKATLLQTLIRCHNSSDPPRALLKAAQLYRNPLLSVLATSYEPDSVVTNWLIWLGVSCDMWDSVIDFDSMSLQPNLVMDFLKTVVHNKHVRILLESFEIFFPENPLRQFVAFLNECVTLNFDYDVLNNMMVAFERSLRYIRSNSIISETDCEITYLSNKIWIQKVSQILVAAVLENNFMSRTHQIEFVNILCATNANNVLHFEQNFNNVLNILMGLYKLDCEIKLDFSQIYDNEKYKNMVHDYLYKLTEKKQFMEAISIAEMENLPKDNILIEQFRTMVNDHHKETFWKSCSDIFHSCETDPNKVIGFFLEYSLETDGYMKFLIHKLAYEWAVSSCGGNIFQIEKEMWFNFINMDTNDQIKALDSLIYKQSYAEMVNQLKKIEVTASVDVTDLKNNLDSAISVLLNYGHFWDALKVAQMFAYKHSDLEILKLCASIAEGMILPNQFNKEQKMLLNDGAAYLHRSKAFRSTRISGYSSGVTDYSNNSIVCSSYEIDVMDQVTKDNLVTLQRLVEKLNSGTTLGQNIFMLYRMSVNIDIPYQVLLENDDDVKLLKDALDDDCRNKLEVVHDFITVNKWSKGKLIDFFCEELINAINNYIKSKSASLVLWDLNLDVEFSLILQLLQENCSLLGMKLFTYSDVLHMSQTLQSGEFKISEISLIVELLIIAHDCFTTDCNMEGISMILKKCQTVIALLLQLQSWKLIVRLVTGIGRYTEMEYVFQILKENDQFEFLLSKGSKRDNNLKLALLDYLKKYCPDNKELYRIVALHFTLFSEVAHLWEIEAEGIIRNLIIISKLEMENNKLDPQSEPFVLFTSTDGTKICLHKAMMNYSHATQYHLQGEKLSKAMNSARQAELIALQRSRLRSLHSGDTTICLLHLNSTQINLLLTKYLSFQEAVILIEAYNYKPDWANVLHEQCIIGGNKDYLDRFIRHFPLTDSLIQDVSRRFLSIKPDTNNVKCMKELLIRLPSVHMKYKLASELGLLDLIEDLLLENKLVYLKDTVWKKGYRN